MSNQESNNQPGVRQTTYKQPGGKVPTEATQATQVQVGTVEGETVLLDHSSAEMINGQRVTLKMSKSNSVHASSVQMEKSAAVSVESERTVLQDSAAARMSADSVRMVKSRAVLISANEAHLEDGSQAVFIVTGGVRGEAQALVTVPAAVVVAALFGLLGALVFAILRGSRR